jgi:hypothetical protein
MIPLSPHSSTAQNAWDVSALASRTGAGELRLRYVVHGAIEGIRLAPADSVHRGDRLWEHTCAEAFVAVEGASGYVELNFSPAREWAAYVFTAYRKGAPLAATSLEPRIVVRRERGAVELDVLVTLADLSPAYRDATLRIGLAMVVEATDGRLTYWALRHPKAQPDFHHADGFVLRLTPSRAADMDTDRGPST